MICTFVAATVPVEKAGDVNPLLDAAKEIGETPSDNEQKAAEGPDENSIGSYERFMSSFGSPTRWAGR